MPKTRLPQSGPSMGEEKNSNRELLSSEDDAKNVTQDKNDLNIALNKLKKLTVDGYIQQKLKEHAQQWVQDFESATVEIKDFENILLLVDALIEFISIPNKQNFARYDVFLTINIQSLNIDLKNLNKLNEEWEIYNAAFKRIFIEVSARNSDLYFLYDYFMGLYDACLINGKTDKEIEIEFKEILAKHNVNCENFNKALLILQSAIKGSIPQLQDKAIAVYHEINKLQISPDELPKITELVNLITKCVASPIKKNLESYARAIADITGAEKEQLTISGEALRFAIRNYIRGETSGMISERESKQSPWPTVETLDKMQDALEEAKKDPVAIDQAVAALSEFDKAFPDLNEKANNQIKMVENIKTVISNQLPPGETESLVALRQGFSEAYDDCIQLIQERERSLPKKIPDRITNVFNDYIAKIPKPLSDEQIEKARLMLAEAQLTNAIIKTKDDSDFIGILKSSAGFLLNEFTKVSPKIEAKDSPKFTKLMYTAKACIEDPNPWSLTEYYDCLDVAESTSIGKLPLKKTKIFTCAVGFGLVMTGATFLILSAFSLGPSMGATAPLAIAGFKIGWDMIMLGVGLLLFAGAGLALTRQNAFFQQGEKFGASVSNAIDLDKEGSVQDVSPTPSGKSKE